MNLSDTRDLNELTNTELVADLGKRFKDYRKRMHITQKEISEQSGLSIFTISTFESGKNTGITLKAFFRLLRMVNQLNQMNYILPNLPKSPKELYLKQFKQHKNGKY